MGGNQTPEPGITVLQHLQFLFTGLDLGLQGPYVGRMRIVLIQFRYLRKRESELFELDNREKFLQLLRAIIPVTGPPVNYAGLKQADFLIMSQCPDGNSAKSGKLVNLILSLCHH